ncbi:MAG TPA: hypothetical protein PLG33_01385 [Prolixibacteraceae bacterium]|nr:hypothetical protein [Prolixibacteraceae bacterium]
MFHRGGAKSKQISATSQRGSSIIVAKWRGIVAWQFDNAVKQYGIAANWCEVTAIQCDIASQRFEIATNRCDIAVKRFDFYKSSFRGETLALLIHWTDSRVFDLL